MHEDNDHNSSDLTDNYKVFFFAGGETRDNKFNIFTGSFIRLLTQILEKDFELIRGIYFRSPMMNVIWALNHAQKPISNSENQKIIDAAVNQILSTGIIHDVQIVLLSSSTGSIVASQTACLLAEKNRQGNYFTKPFHLVLGASMLSQESELFRKLIQYQKDGAIGTILYDEVQDEGDSSEGVGGMSRKEAYSNAFGLMFPWFSRKFKRPSFLNTNPETGHIHRRRSQTVQKAKDYINIILIEHKLAGEKHKEKAISVINTEFN
jgi:hypothetical protein